MTEIFLAGGENPSHQSLLVNSSVTQVAVNVTSLLRRSSLEKWSLDLPREGWEWVAYTDGPVSEGDLELVLDRAAKPPKWVVGPPSWGDRQDYIPLWNGEGEMPGYRPSGMAVTDRVFKDKVLQRRSLASRLGDSVLGAITGSTDPAIGKFDFVISGAWWSIMKFGETQVWDGQKLHRYSAERQAEVRARHSEHIDALGIDVSLVLLGDPDECCRLAIASWESYALHLTNPAVRVESEATIAPVGDGMELGSDPNALATAPPPGRHRILLPIIGQGVISTTEKGPDGEDQVEEQVVIQSLPDTVRKCDNCHLASSGCPGFVPQASCAYAIPVVIRSKDQLQSVMSAMNEMQTQRVLEARFAEQIQGQELSPEVGREMDRLFKNIEKMKDIMDNRELVKITVDGRGGAGVISRLFGSSAGANAKMLSEPVDSTAVTEIIEDAEVLEDL